MHACICMYMHERSRAGTYEQRGIFCSFYVVEYCENKGKIIENAWKKWLFLGSVGGHAGSVEGLGSMR